MNKLLKGSIAVAAGIALLLGGAGTFALWNDSAATAGGTVTTGTMSILPGAAAGVWNDMSTGTAVSIDPAVVKMVPGDTWTFTKTVEITAAGKNLQADLTFDPSTIIAASGTPTEELGYTFTAAAASGASLATVTSATPAIAANTVRFKPTVETVATSNVTFVFTIKYNNVTTNVKTGQAKAVDLSKFAVKLTQVRP